MKSYKKRLLAIVLFCVSMILYSTQGTAEASDALAKKTIDRWPDRVIMEGNLVKDLVGKPIANLRVYAYRDEVFEPIRFQIDENSQLIGSLEPKTVYLVPHMHCDPEWQKSFEECAERGSEGIIGAIHMIENYPEFRFVVEPVVIVKYFLEHYPQYKEEFIRFVKEGKIEIPGMWVSPDENLPSDESLVRTILIGHEWLKGNGMESGKVAWQIDSFGHPATMPHLFKNAGYKYLTFARLDYTRVALAELLKILPVDLGYPTPVGLEFLHYGVNTPRVVDFWWESPDGDRILTHWMMTHYGLPLPALGVLPSNEQDATLQMALAISLLVPFSPTSVMMQPIGGDFLNPEAAYPTLPQFVRYWNAELYPKTGYKLVIATPTEFFQALEKESEKLPVYKADYNPALGSAWLSGKIELKQWNRGIESNLFSLEKFSTIASLLGQPYPKDDLDKLWETAAFNYHHDTITGTSPESVANIQRERFRNLLNQSGELLNQTLFFIADKIDTANMPGQPLIVFNPLSWDRTDLVSVNIEFDKPGYGSIEIRDLKGNIVPGQITSLTTYPDGSLKEAELIFIAENVPSLGYNTYSIIGSPLSGPLSSTPTAGNTLENPHYRIVVDPEKGGSIVSLYDKEDCWEVLKPIGSLLIGAGLAKTQGNDVIGSYEVPAALVGGFLGMFISSRDVIYTHLPLYKTFNTSGSKAEVKIIENGPVRKTLRAIVKGGNTTFVKDISIYDKLGRVDFRIYIPQFNETDPMQLEVAFPFNVEGGVPFYELPYGVISRTDYRYNYPAYTFVDITNGDRGVAFINRGNPGYHVEGDTATLLLMRQSGEGFEYNYGKDFTFDYSLYPHSGDWECAQVYKKGRGFNNPLIAIQTSYHKGILPQRFSFVDSNHLPVIISTLRMDKKSNVILRIYNPNTHKVSGNVSLNDLLFLANKKIADAYLTDLVEQDCSSISIKNDNISFELENFGLLTLKMQIKPSDVFGRIIYIDKDNGACFITTAASSTDATPRALHLMLEPALGGCTEILNSLFIRRVEK